MWYDVVFIGGFMKLHFVDDFGNEIFVIMDISAAALDVWAFLDRQQWEVTFTEMLYHFWSERDYV
jgi:hypothetical protein